ncbi:MAG: CvpA family protein [Chthoniobacteraceae bacterium]
MDLSADTLRIAYYGVSAIFVGALGWSGWRQGVARQIMTLAAVACAYAAAYYGASSAAPVFAFLKYPPQVTTLIGGTAVGCTTFLGVHGLRRWLFRRTAEQKNASVRMSYGILGAILGVTFGSLLFLFTTLTVRSLGTVAQSRVDDAELEKKQPSLMAPPDDPGQLVRNFAKLGSALGEGTSGKFLKRYDDVPVTHVFATLAKLGIMVSRPDAVDRFLAYPGVEKLASHPKLVAVKNDPEVFQLLNDRSFVKLLRHDKVLALANDAEFKELMQKMEFEKALDFALKPQPVPDGPQPPHPPREVLADPSALPER